MPLWGQPGVNEGVIARLVYDGQCGFCRYTVEYARALTSAAGGEVAVEYRAYQSVAADHPDVSEAEFRASIQLFVDGRRYQGAEAAFRTLAFGGRGWWLGAYRHVPAFAAVCEWLYRRVAEHRAAAYRVCVTLFGRRLRPRHHVRTAAIVYRGIALCALSAFLSFWWQATALIGTDGILPFDRYLDSALAGYGSQAYFLLPSALWLGDSNLALHFVCGVGVVATAVGVLGRLRCSMALIAYLAYLSLLHAGQTFMAYQWDTLLLECLILAAVLAAAPTVGVWLTRLLLFRFILLSGVVKLASGDPTWADGTALAYHFETQPLPTLVAWYADRLPAWMLQAATWATLVIELALAWLVLLPRNPRWLAGAGIVLLQTLILATGSYNFFNLLTLVLCVALLDDREPLSSRHSPAPKRRGTTAAAALTAVIAAVLIAAQGLAITSATLRGRPAPDWVRTLAPLHLVNGYGLFSVMTTERRELIIEGSLDGETWVAYGFPFKPGPPGRVPLWATPHQPRLDWQMWFAALSHADATPWMWEFVFALLESRRPVLTLIDDPFDGEPPRFLRILSRPYRFTEAAERRESGRWWQAGPAQLWLEPVRLRTPKVSHGPLTLDDHNPRPERDRD